MIKKQKYQWFFILALLGLGLIAYYFYYSQKPNFGQASSSKSAVSDSKTTQAKKTPVPAEEMVINGRKVIGISPGKSAADIKDYTPSNTPSPVWKKAVEKSITRQVGDKVKNLTIKQVESLIWVQDRIPLNVESIIISFQDAEGRPISFRAMVDSQSGRVLQTWDQPVIDRFDGKDSEGIKVDPRYGD